MHAFVASEKGIAVDSAGGFDGSLEGNLTVKTLGDGIVHCEFEVQKRHSNAFGMLHGVGLQRRDPFWFV